MIQYPSKSVYEDFVIRVSERGIFDQDRVNDYSFFLSVGRAIQCSWSNELFGALKILKSQKNAGNYNAYRVLEYSLVYLLAFCAKNTLMRARHGAY